MTAYTNGAGGKSLVAGDFDAAVAQVRRNTADAMTLQTNRCVAYTMTGQFDSAQSVCDSAIRNARHDLSGVSASTLWQREMLSEYLAIAYSNRAVLHWLSHDAVAAARDLADAVELSPKAEFVARNITALRSPHDTRPQENAVAQVAVTPKS